MSASASVVAGVALALSVCILLFGGFSSSSSVEYGAFDAKFSASHVEAEFNGVNVGWVFEQGKNLRGSASAESCPDFLAGRFLFRREIASRVIDPDFPLCAVGLVLAVLHVAGGYALAWFGSRGQEAPKARARAQSRRIERSTPAGAPALGDL